MISETASAHARLGSWSIGNIHRVNTGLLECLHTFDHLGGIASLGRHNLNTCHKVATREFLREAGSLGKGHGIDLNALFVHGDGVDSAPPRTQGADRICDQLDVSRCRSTTAADELHAGIDQTLGVFRHVFRRTHVHLPALNIAGHAGIWLR